MLKVLILLLVLALSEAGRKSPKLTLSKTGCKCWWDLEGQLIDPKTDKPYSCACCKPNGKQCGYPQHNWCTHKKSKTGCKAVNHFRYTLSEVITIVLVIEGLHYVTLKSPFQIGHPCHFDTSRRDCAWCNFSNFSKTDTQPKWVHIFNNFRWIPMREFHEEKPRTILQEISSQLFWLLWHK